MCTPGSCIIMHSFRLVPALCPDMLWSHGPCVCMSWGGKAAAEHHEGFFSPTWTWLLGKLKDNSSLSPGGGSCAGMCSHNRLELPQGLSVTRNRGKLTQTEHGSMMQDDPDSPSMAPSSFQPVSWCFPFFPFPSQGKSPLPSPLLTLPPSLPWMASSARCVTSSPCRRRTFQSHSASWA